MVVVLRAPAGAIASFKRPAVRPAIPHRTYGRRTRPRRPEQRLRQAIADFRRIAHGVCPVLLKEAGLRLALHALGEERPVPHRDVGTRTRQSPASTFSLLG